MEAFLHAKGATAAAAIAGGGGMVELVESAIYSGTVGLSMEVSDIKKGGAVGL